MAQSNRELSQFGSFLEVDNANKNIGITTQATPYVGIGTTNPIAKLHVVGDTNVSGIISATGYYLNGNELVNAALQTWEINGSDIYRATGNVGIGSSIPGSKLTVAGDITATGAITGSDLSVGGIATASRFVSTVTSGTAPLTVTSTTQVINLNASLLAGKTPPTGDLVGTTDNQVLTNKTLTNPVISSIVNGTFTSTVPSVNGTLVSTGSTAVVTGNMITDLSLTNADIATNAGITYGKLSLTNSILNADIAVGAGITYGKLNLTGFVTNADIATNAGISVSKLSANTISGITLGSNLATLTFGTYLTGTSYNGSTAVEIATNASTSGNSNIVARDGSGNFSAGTITATSFVGDGSGLTNLQGAGSTITSVTTSSTNSQFKVPFVNTTENTTGNYELLQDSESTFTYNPSTNTLTVTNGNFGGILTATTFVGPLTGTASTATNCSRQILSGSGMSFSGGALNVDRTITLGTPSTITGSTSNSTSSSSHTHALTVDLGVTAGTTAGPIITNSAGTNATIPTASNTQSGAVTTGNQTWAGSKTFEDRVLFNSTNNFPGLNNTDTGTTISAVGLLCASRNADQCITANRNTNGSVVSFHRSGTQVGSIDVTASVTSYVTSSDYRLKENITLLDGAIDRLKQLPVHRFNFIVDPENTVDGFLAHEAAVVVPECASGEKDAEDEDGNPIYQGIDQSKLVPLLTAALQEAIKKIETLEVKVSQLEAL